MLGSYVSMLGTRITTIACPLLALYLTNSPITAGLIAFVATAPSVLLYVPAGALVDQWDPRRTMLYCETGRGVAVALVTVTLALGKLSISLLAAAVFVEEVLEVFSTLADQRYVRSLVTVDQASSAQARIETRTHAVLLAGRPIGAFLFNLAPTLPFLTDAITFVVSVSTIARIASHRIVAARTGPAPSRWQPERLRSDIGGGLKWLFHDRYARAAMTLSASTTLIAQALIMVFLAEAHASGMSSVTVGLVLGASGAGGLLGSAAVSRLPVLPKASLILIQLLAWVGTFTVLAASGVGSLPWMTFTMVMLSFTGSLGNVEIGTYLIKRVDENMLARVTGIARMMAFSACAAGPILGGVLVQWHGAQNAVLALLAFTLAVTLVAACSPSMRNCQEILKSTGRESLVYLRLRIATYGSLIASAADGARNIEVAYLRAAIIGLTANGSSLSLSAKSASSSDGQLRNILTIPANGYVRYTMQPWPFAAGPSDCYPYSIGLLDSSSHEQVTAFSIVGHRAGDPIQHHAPAAEQMPHLPAGPQSSYSFQWDFPHEDYAAFNGNPAEHPLTYVDPGIAPEFSEKIVSARLHPDSLSRAVADGEIIGTMHSVDIEVDDKDRLVAAYLYPRITPVLVLQVPGIYSGDNG